MVIPGDVVGPMMVRFPAIAGKVALSVILPMTLNLIVSVPVPAAQPFVGAFALAAVIASRNAQMPGAPGSAVELTVMVAARAADAVARAMVAISATGKHARQRNPQYLRLRPNDLLLKERLLSPIRVRSLNIRLPAVIKLMVEERQTLGHRGID